MKSRVTRILFLATLMISIVFLLTYQLTHNKYHMSNKEYLVSIPASPKIQSSVDMKTELTQNQTVNESLREGISKEQFDQIVKPIRERIIGFSVRRKHFVFKIENVANPYIFATFIKGNKGAWHLSEWETEQRDFSYFFE
ncbi:hypothetical protein Pan241w_06670 [Gimesia alba]|uniref:Uncharacterized protein n=1 Tax=Gimesia alba TaxID=2527973 RepID=A0A517R9N7_9PLAN|nr:hypothetical protein [Gimesia alba]QDT40609.1 hypothetical protein Pan241w_06670 [Gimesia alba]